MFAGPNSYYTVNVRKSRTRERKDFGAVYLLDLELFPKKSSCCIIWFESLGSYLNNTKLKKHLFKINYAAQNGLNDTL